MTDTQAIGEGAAQVALSLVAMFVPVIGPAISIIKEAIPAFIAAQPYMEKAIKNGESAFAAAAKADPLLAGNLRKLALHLLGQATEEDLEHMTRTMGYSVLGWSDDETKRWLDNASPPGENDSSFGGGAP
jgi:hypothetical protein